MDKIFKWTDDRKMKLNEKKSKIMVFNFTQNYQFAIRVYLNDNLLENISETRLLGITLSSDLSWKKNTQYVTSFVSF